MRRLSIVTWATVFQSLVWALLLLAALPVGAQRVTTFTWTNSPLWPAGTMVEVCGNGNVCTMVAGETATLTLPLQPGDVIQGRARAVTPAGYQCGEPLQPCPYSEWATVSATWPAPPIGTWARKETKGGTVADPTFHTGVGARNDGIASTLNAPSMATTTGRYLFVGVSHYTSGVDISGVSDTAGNTYTKAGSTQGGDSSHDQEIWYTANPITGNAANIVTVTFNGSAIFRVITVGEFSLSGSTSVAYSSEATGVITLGTTHTSNSVTTTAADALVIGMAEWWGDGSPSNLTATSGSWAYVATSGSRFGLMYLNTDAAGGYTWAFTSASTNDFYLTAKAFNFTVSGGTPTGLPRRAIDGPFYGALRGSVR